jgi:hypothetical protein
LQLRATAARRTNEVRAKPLHPVQKVPARKLDSFIVKRKIGMTDSPLLPRPLIRQLEPVVGATLVLEDECVLEQEGTATATAYGTVAGVSTFRCDVVVKLLVACPEVDSECVHDLRI